MIKRMSTKKAKTTKAKSKVRKPKAIESAAFRFRADANGETRFTVTEACWLRDALDTLLTSGEDSNNPMSLSFTRSLYAYVHDKAITRGEFHENAERLLMEYGLNSSQPVGAGNPTIM
jgi:hypothetical protein